MRIEVNGAGVETKADNLAALVAELGYQPGLVATALNQEFVRAKDRDATVLRDGDSVEILMPRQGG